MFSEIKNLLLPTKSELFFWPALALFLLVAQNVSRFWSYFSGISFEQVKSQTDVALQAQNWILGREAQLDPRIADFIVWMILGMVVISIILFLQSGLRNANDERDLVEHMNNPSTRAHELEVYALKIAIRIAAVLGALVYLRVFVSSINPALTKLFFTSSLTLNDPASWLWLLLAIFAMAVALYVFALFVRIALLRTRVLN